MSAKDDFMHVVVTDFGEVAINPTTWDLYQRVCKGRAKAGGKLATKRTEERLVRNVSAISEHFYMLGKVPPYEL